MRFIEIVLFIRYLLLRNLISRNANKVIRPIKTIIIWLLFALLHFTYRTK